MSTLEPFMLGINEKLSRAIEILEKSKFRNILVVDEKNTVIGTIGNHEIRHALLSEKSAEVSLAEVAKKEFLFAAESISVKQARQLLFQYGIDVLPVLDESGRYLTAHTLPRNDVSILIMAGGLGSRLYPLTSEIPKSLVVVAGKPVLAHIIDRFLEFGFAKFYISISYKGELIMKWIEEEYTGKNLEFIFLSDPENNPLGTAGALTLLPEEVDCVLVQNTDVLCNFDVDNFLEEHIKSNAEKTILVSKWSVTCPYGVVRTDSNEANLSIIEKPEVVEWINGGIYLLNRSTWHEIPRNTKLSMIDFFGNTNNPSRSVRAYRHTGNWIDMGSHETLSTANTREWGLSNE